MLARRAGREHARQAVVAAIARADRAGGQERVEFLDALLELAGLEKAQGIRAPASRESLAFGMPESWSRGHALGLQPLPGLAWDRGARDLHRRRTGARSACALPLSWRTRNYVGTIFGGSLYGAADPMYMIMLIRNLGPAYTVWDKAATIRFLKPGRTTLYARFVLEEAEIAEIRRLLETAPSIDRVYVVELADAEGVIHARSRRRSTSGAHG